MKRVNNSPKSILTVPINKYVLKLIENRFNGKRTLNFNGKTLKKDNVVYLYFLLTKLQVSEEKNGHSAFALYSKLLKTDFVYDYKTIFSFFRKRKHTLYVMKTHDTYRGLSRVYSMN